MSAPDFQRKHVIAAVNADESRCASRYGRPPRTAGVVIDRDLHAPGTRLACLYSTAADEIGRKIRVETRGDGARIDGLTVPPAGFVMYG